LQPQLRSNLQAIMTTPLLPLCMHQTIIRPALPRPF
jgi:hypothetical protein